MKKILFIVIFLIPLLAKAQDLEYTPNIQIDTNANKIHFMSIVDLPGISKDKIYDRAYDWFTRYFDMMHVYISMANKKEGKIIGRGTGIGKINSGVITVGYVFNFNVYLTIADSKFKYSITDFVELKGVDIQERVPILVASDIYINDQKYRNKKGEFTSNAKQHLYYIEGSANLISNSLKDALSSSRLDHKIISDNF